VTADNPLLQPLETLFQRLVVLTGLVRIVEDQLQGYRRLFTRQFDELDARHVFAGFNLIVWDIAPPAREEPSHWRQVSSFSAGGKDYFELTDLFVRREAAWTVSQAYEAFEAYLKDVLAAYLAGHPQDSQLISLRQPPEAADFASWRAALHSGRWSSTALLGALRLIQPSISTRETTNDRDVHMDEWHQILQEIRHAATHSDMRIRHSRIARWPPSRIRLLRRKFPGQAQNGDYVLQLTRDAAQSAIQTAADYAFLLFKCLSQSSGYDWDILRQPDANSDA